MLHVRNVAAILSASENIRGYLWCAQYSGHADFRTRALTNGIKLPFFDLLLSSVLVMHSLCTSVWSSCITVTDSDRRSVPLYLHQLVKLGDRLQRSRNNMNQWLQRIAALWDSHHDAEVFICVGFNMVQLPQDPQVSSAMPDFFQNSWASLRCFELVHPWPAGCSRCSRDFKVTRHAKLVITQPFHLATCYGNSTEDKSTKSHFFSPGPNLFSNTIHIHTYFQSLWIFTVLFGPRNQHLVPVASSR